MAEKHHDALKMVLIFLAPLACAFVALFCGRYTLSLSDVCSSLATILPFVPDDTVPETVRLLVVEVRLPRVLAALAVGAALSASGAAFQGVFRNPLVNPGLLGDAGYRLHPSSATRTCAV